MLVVVGISVTKKFDEITKKKLHPEIAWIILDYEVKVSYGQYRGVIFGTAFDCMYDSQKTFSLVFITWLEMKI